MESSPLNLRFRCRTLLSKVIISKTLRSNPDTLKRSAVFFKAVHCCRVFVYMAFTGCFKFGAKMLLYISIQCYIFNTRYKMFIYPLAQLFKTYKGISEA